MTNPNRCLHCLEAEASHPVPAQLCDECYAAAAGGVDESEAERLYLDGVYDSPLTAFESLVATAVDAAINGERTLDGRAYAAVSL